jgi:hypothetical protein
MTNSQGYNPFNSSIAQGRASQNLPKRSSKPDFCNFEQKATIDVESLVKSILCICHKCDGALVPEERCLVCHRVSMRKCVSCGNEIPMNIHQSCENLVLFSNMIKTKYHLSKNEAKN